MQAFYAPSQGLPRATLAWDDARRCRVLRARGVFRAPTDDASADPSCLPQIHPNKSLPVSPRCPFTHVPSTSAEDLPVRRISTGASHQPGTQLTKFSTDGQKVNRPHPLSPFCFFVSGAAAYARHWTESLPSCFPRLWVHVSGSRAGGPGGERVFQGDDERWVRCGIHLRLISAPRFFGAGSHSAARRGGGPRLIVIFGA